MATASSTKTVTGAAPAAPVLTIPPLVTPRRPPLGASVVLVGAGGTGARLAVMAVKMLKAGDRLMILDDDVLEERNLNRQHFIGADVGRPKAEVVAERLAQEGRRVGFEVDHRTQKFSKELMTSLRRETALGASAIIIGCVDNKTARRAIWDAISLAPSAFRSVAYIDTGNDIRGGQAVLSLWNWPVWEASHLGRTLFSSRAGYQATAAANQLRDGHDDGHYNLLHLPALKELYPQLLEPEAPAALAEACAVRIDLQTVAANALAATWGATMLSWLLDELPFSAAGIGFSTLGSAQSHLLHAVQNGGSTGDSHGNLFRATTQPGVKFDASYKGWAF